MDFKKLAEPLSIHQIDFRIQSINKGGYATILAYKDARVDMQRLDDVVGPTNWKREHTRDNHNCIVSVWDESKKQWVSKEDTGTESNTEAEKGLASDSFKRACFNWGIGRELYDYPVISVPLKREEWEMSKDRNGKDRPVQTWNLKLREWTWHSEHEDGKLSKLSAVDQTGELRFSWPSRVTAPQTGEPEKPWFNDLDKLSTKMAEKVRAGEATEKSIIENLSKQYRISKKVRSDIHDLVTDNAPPH